MRRPSQPDDLVDDEVIDLVSIEAEPPVEVAEPGPSRPRRWWHRRPPRPRATWPARFVGLFLFVLFLAPLIAPIALLATGVPPGAPENREPTALPPTVDLLTLDVDALGQLQDWFRDRLPGLDAAVAADAQFDLLVRGTSPNPAVVLGRSGWLFLNWTVEQPCLSAQDVAAADATFGRLRRAARDGGRQLVLLVVPDKAAVHHDQLQGVDRRRTCAFANAVALAEGLTDRNALIPLDLLEARVARGEPTYHRLDSHWTDEAAHDVVRHLVEHLGLDTSDATLEAGAEARVREDLRFMQGLRTWRDDTCWRMVRPGVEVGGASDDCTWHLDRPVRTSASTSSTAALLPPTTFVQDSYGLRMIEVLPPWFQRLTVVHKPDLQDFDLREIIEDSRIVVLEVVQRRLPAILGDPDLVAMLEDALATPYAS